jgi:acylpyruvate hydrolase
VCPPTIICVGLNYACHAAESGIDLPTFPTLFAKFASSPIGAYDDLVLPAVSSEVDWEVELAFVGTPRRNLSHDEARDSIAGYTVANDVSMRDWQRRTSQFLQGKASEASTPVGPVLVTPEELPGGSAEDLQLTCEVDGIVMQESRTSDLIFGPAAVAAYVSEVMDLAAGNAHPYGDTERHRWGADATRVPPGWPGHAHYDRGHR